MHFFHPFKWQCSCSKRFSCVHVDDRADIRFSITIRMLAYLGPFIDHKRCVNASKTNQMNAQFVFVCMDRCHQCTKIKWKLPNDPSKVTNCEWIEATFKSHFQHIFWSKGTFFVITGNFKRNAGNDEEIAYFCPISVSISISGRLKKVSIWCAIHSTK